MAVPSPVLNIRVFSLLSDGQYLITWPASQETNIASYKVYRSGSPTDNSAFELIGTVTSPVTSFQYQVPFTFGIVFYYKVTAVDTDANESSLEDTTPSYEGTFHSFEEQPFPVTVTTQSFVVGEIPQGAVNGTNLVFTLSYPSRKNTVEMFVNSLTLIRAVDFTETAPQTITFITAPQTGDKVRVNYLRY